jgi:hypothetical protein
LPFIISQISEIGLSLCHATILPLLRQPLSDLRALRGKILHSG